MENTVQNISSPASKGWLKTLFIILGVVVVLLAVWFAFGDKLLAAKPVGSKYQAVFLSNGQVYFGKLKLQGKSAVLSDIYYLQVTQDLQATGGTESTPAAQQTNKDQQQRINLVKLGQELHGPEDTMYIERDKILFWENLKDDSKVVESINQAKK